MRKRDMSEFMTIELLYDYKIGKLDAIRSEAIQEGLKHSPVAQAELDKISFGIEYCEALKEVQVSDELIKRLLYQPTFTQKLLHYISWKNFPQTLKWALEGMIVAAVVALFATQFSKYYDNGGQVNQPIVAQTFKVPETQIKPDMVESEYPDLVEEESLSPLNVIMPEEEVETTVPISTQQIVSDLKKQEKEILSATLNKYELFRLKLKAKNPQKASEDVASIVSSLGGEKAGEVELGWDRGEGIYFHFTISQEKQAALLDKLNSIGSYVIEKSEYTKEAPAGSVRYIVWIEK